MKYPDEKQLEGIGVYLALMTGACNKCEHLKRCESDESFAFPADAACMVRKRELKQTKEGAAE